MTDTKGKLIEEILAFTKADPPKHVDRLSDISLSHLTKLAKVCKLLKNAI